MTNQPLQILVVEDDSADRMQMKRALLASGIRHELHFAEDHESGKKATTGIEYDCIFLDYNLPGGTGLELLKAIRESKNSSPIIIVTSHGDEKLAVEAMKNGANDYIPKGLLTPDGLAQSIRYIVNLRENERRSAILEQQLHDTQKQLQTVVANSPIILFSLDDQAEFTLFEGKGLKALGIDNMRYLHKQLKPGAVLPINLDDYKKAMEGEEVIKVTEMNSNFFEVYYSPIYKDGFNHVIGVIGVASDITTHVQAERELKEAKQLAEQTAKVKEQFLANMSHEIRTPMNGIMGLTRILLNTPLDEEQTRYMQSIKTCSDGLLVIINDILDLSKIDAGKMSFENIPFRISDVANHTLELFRSKADEKSLGITLFLDPTLPPAVSGDQTRLGQILNNLVSNAIKFTLSGDVGIYITTRSIRPENVTVDFEVRDTGIGISEQNIQTVFDSFTQASSDTTRKYGGTGLGLTIVKKLIELQGGTVALRSKTGIGTSFYFHLTFPIATESQIEDQLTGELEQLSISHLKVLAAEDNPINQLILKKLFSDWKAKIVFADNGKEALTALEAAEFDLILMDMQMPEMDGYTASGIIRKEFKGSKQNIPIIAFTAHATNSERTKCLQLGINDYISKPFDPADLKKKILELTNLKGKTLKAISQGSVQSDEDSSSLTNTMKKTEKSVSNQDKESRTSLEKSDLTIENATAKSTVPHPEHKINLSYLKSIAEENDAFLIEMIEMFLNKTPLALEKMNECLKQQNWEELRQIAHRIKPSFGYIGMKNSQNTLAEIERLSEEQKEMETVPSLLQEVETASHEAFTQLKKELGTLR